MEPVAPQSVALPLGERLAGPARAVLPPLLGLAVLIGLWYVATLKGGSIPGPGQVWDAAVALFADPFYRKGPNDQGIGWNVLSSLQRVGIGFGFAALVGIPLGFILGRSAFLAAMVNPVISLLRRCRRWPGCRSACSCSRRPTRRRPTPSSSARSGR